MVSPLTSKAPRSLPFWLVIAVATLIPASLAAVTTSLNFRLTRGTVDWSTVASYSALWLFFGAVSPIIYFLAKRFPLKREVVWRNLAVQLGGVAVLCICWTLLGVLLAMILGRLPPHETFLKYYFSWLLVNLPWSVFLYATVFGCIYAVVYYREARERESQQARLAAQLAEARLGALRMQLHPHFLFNSLNAITVLVRDHNTEDASKMLELLSGVLRQVLQGEHRQEVTLADEINFLEKYLAIEQVRFSDRLQVRWSVAPETRDALVPEFVLQPLVENAIRHGVAKRAAVGVIEISAATTNGSLALSVEDNGPGYDPSAEAGVGISNTRARLKTLFGDAGKLELSSQAGSGTVATLTFPLRRSSDG
ncbi:MAG TPA: histidine kinase [Pyrinomonadaceae bacterium]|nr:histidine kinase [Pyrinomonadaceae bacterium]